MMTKLFEAVPKRARLILLGDADQLASVEAGAVLGDLCRELDQGVVALTHTYRFGADSGVGVSRAMKRIARTMRSTRYSSNIQSEPTTDVSRTTLDFVEE